jgi:hypothetical protein
MASENAENPKNGVSFETGKFFAQTTSKNK